MMLKPGRHIVPKRPSPAKGEERNYFIRNVEGFYFCGTINKNFVDQVVLTKSPLAAVGFTFFKQAADAIKARKGLGAPWKIVSAIELASSR